MVPTDVPPTDADLRGAPFDALRADRAAARAAGDANAELCWFASAGEDGPSVRTLVLRDLGDALALFVNDSGAKGRQLAADPRCEVVLWLPSLQRQWRLAGRVEALATERLAQHWPRRPRSARLMDRLHDEGLAQGAELPDRETLHAAHGAADAALPEPTPVADCARALALLPERVECLQIVAAPALHRRRAWTREDGAWRVRELVP